MAKTIRLKLLILIGITVLALPAKALAHCPLCTAGAGLAALGAYWLGVNGLTVGLLIGAFAAALGLWLNKIIPKKYFPGQKYALVLFSWLTTLWPLKNLLSDYTSIFINWNGQYNSLLNRTYLINLFLVGGLIGAILVDLAPSFSRWLSGRRQKTMPFQTMTITLALVLIASLITQLVF